MKKVLAFLVAGTVLLAGCTGPEVVDPPTSNLPEIDNTLPYFAHLIGGPEFYGWFDKLEAARAIATVNTGDVFMFHKVESALESKELVAELTEKKSKDHVNLIFVGLEPNDYVGVSEEEAAASFDTNKAFIQSLIDITLNEGVVLFVGNAYPKSLEETDEFLLWNHEETRLFLKEQMESTNRVFNFTLKRPLGDRDGALNAELTDEDINNVLTSEFGTYLTLAKNYI